MREKFMTQIPFSRVRHLRPTVSRVSGPGAPRWLSRLLFFGLLFSATAFAQIGATSPKPPPSNSSPATIKQLSAEEIGAMFERPTTAQQLLQNIKTAMDRDLLVQTAFYTDENLKKLFNGTGVTWEVRASFSRGARRGEMIVNQTVFPKMYVEIRHGDYQSPIKNASGVALGPIPAFGKIIVDVRSIPGFIAVEVERVFGKKLKKMFDGPISLSAHRPELLSAPAHKGTFSRDYLKSDDLLESLDRDASTESPFSEKQVSFAFMFRSSDLPWPNNEKRFFDDDVVESIELTETER